MQTFTRTLNDGTEQVTRYLGPWRIAVSTTNVLCSDGKRRTVRYVGEPDTFFTHPCRVSVKGKTVSGFVSYDYGTDGLVFHAYQYRKNGHLLP